ALRADARALKGPAKDLGQIQPYLPRFFADLAGFRADFFLGPPALFRDAGSVWPASVSFFRTNSRRRASSKVHRRPNLPAPGISPLLARSRIVRAANPSMAATASTLIRSRPFDSARAFGSVRTFGSPRTFDWGLLRLAILQFSPRIFRENPAHGELL